MAQNLPALQRPGFQKGVATHTLVDNPIELLDCYDEYERKAIADEDPISRYGFVAFAQRRFGIDNRWWGRHSRGDKDASKLPGLQQAVVAIEARIAGHLATGGMKGTIHAGMAEKQLERMESRDELVAEKEARARLAKEDSPETSKEQIANILHPQMTAEQYEACVAAGLPVPLYSPQQLEAGVPLWLPALPDE